MFAKIFDDGGVVKRHRFAPTIAAVALVAICAACAIDYATCRREERIRQLDDARQRGADVQLEIEGYCGTAAPTCRDVTSNQHVEMREDGCCYQRIKQCLCGENFIVSDEWKRVPCPADVLRLIWFPKNWRELQSAGCHQTHGE